MKYDVTFDSAGIPLAAHLYVPEGTAQRKPAIVVGHPGSGVKEQAAGLYASKLAEHGFVTLAFDAAYQGESQGLPRGLEDPAHRIEDIKAAVSYVAIREEVDADRIGVLGICASGGYALNAAASDHRIKALATVSGADIVRQFRFGADGDQDPAVFQAMLDAAAQARSGTGPQTFQLFPDNAEEARRLGGQHAVDGFDYYRTERGEHPRSMTHMAWESVDHMAIFDLYAAVPLITQPLLMIVGRNAVTSWMSVEAFQRATGPKWMHWIEGAGHVDLYDKYAGEAVEQLAAFYFRNGMGLPSGTTVSAFAASGSSS
jgi:uncharacterized protein